MTIDTTGTLPPDDRVGRRQAARATTAEDVGQSPAPRPTTVDAARSAAPTTAEDAAPATRPTVAEDSASPARQGAGRPTISDDVPTPGQRYSLIGLPPELSGRYTVVEHLGGGGEAQVLRCVRNADGTEVAVKLYLTNSDRLDLDLLRRAQNVDPAHVAQLFEADRNRREAWEVMEYFPAGTLADMMADRPGAWPEDAVHDVLTELHAAISALPANVTHRDVKPQNIFVRTREPLDLVLGDFGAVFERHAGTSFDMVIGTHGYMPPEGVAGRVSDAFDWWGLGIVIYELLVGRHPLADPDGRMPDNNRLRAETYDPLIDTDVIADPRWRLLIRGLTRRDYHLRWKSAEVGAWLAGESPAVGDEAPRGVRSRPLNLMDTLHHSPADVAQTFRTRSEEAADYLSSRAHEELRDWLRTTSVGNEADALFASLAKGSARPYRAAVELQLILAPDQEPGFRGRVVSGAGLTRAVTDARGGDSEAQAWVGHLIDERVLSLLGSYRDDEWLSGTDERLRMWLSARDRLVGRLPSGLRTLPQVPEADAILLAAALDQNAAEALLDQGRHDFAGGRRPDGYPDQEPSNPGEALVATTLLPAWRDQQQREREAARRAEEEQARQQAEAARQAELERQRQRKEADRAERRSRLRATRGRLVTRLVLFSLLCGGTALLLGREVGLPWTSDLVRGVITAAVIAGGTSLIDIVLIRVPARALAWLCAWSALVIALIEWLPTVGYRDAGVSQFPNLGLWMVLGYAFGALTSELMGRVFPTRTTEPHVIGAMTGAGALVLGVTYLVLDKRRLYGQSTSGLVTSLAPWYVHLLNRFVTATHPPTVDTGLVRAALVVAVVLGLLLLASGSGINRLPRNALRGVQMVQVALTLALVWVAPLIAFVSAYYLGIIGIGVGVVAIGIATVGALAS